MKIYDCNEFTDNIIRNEKFDFCIIGAGIAGIILADQLSKKYNIAIVESGDFSVVNKVQELNELIVSGYPMRENYQSRIRQFGGACNLWPGRSLILNEIDFENRDWVEDSGWPIKKAEIDKYYSLLDKEYNMFSYAYFNDKKNDDFEDDLYKSIFEDSMFNSIKAGWSKKVPRFGKKSRTYKKLINNTNITLYKNATVEKLLEENKAVKYCKIILNNMQSFNISAENFVLATGGLENARILLSSNDNNKNGLGNHFDNVGRYYMDHPSYVRRDIKLNKKIYNSSLFLKPLDNGRFKNGIRLSEEYQRNSKLANNYIEFSPQYPQSYEDTFASVIQVAKIALKKGSSSNRLDFRKVSVTKIPEIIYLLSPSEMMPHWMNKYYYKFNKLINRPINCDSIVISHHLEQTPNRNSRVTLSDEKNYLGINKLNLNWVINDLEIKTANILENKVVDKLKNNGWIDSSTQYQEISSFKDASHHIGTTRMSNDEKNGVVDMNCKVFSIDNLYIAGSSVFPTSGNANPTYTIAALTLRLAKYLEKKYEDAI
jgi:choline dehydrogenase-like flavoprotein